MTIENAILDNFLTKKQTLGCLGRFGGPILPLQLSFCRATNQTRPYEPGRQRLLAHEPLLRCPGPRRRKPGCHAGPRGTPRRQGGRPPAVGCAVCAANSAPRRWPPLCRCLPAAAAAGVADPSPLCRPCALRMPRGGGVRLAFPPCSSFLVCHLVEGHCTPAGMCLVVGRALQRFANIPPRMVDRKVRKVFANGC